MPCANAAHHGELLRDFDQRVRDDYVGQPHAWAHVRAALEAYAGLAPRATCLDWTLHFTGPSGSGKSFLASIVADAAFQPWEDEPYPRAQVSLASTSCALLATVGLALGPLGASMGCAAGIAGAYSAMDAAKAAMPSLQRTFRAPKPFPAQCGVRQHKLSRHSTLAEVEAWEYSVAAELLREPAAIIVLDDVGRLSDGAAYQRLGELLCGVGGNSIPQFRSGAGSGAELVSATHALFVLTSDLELSSESAMSCDAGSFEQMISAVSVQSARFWAERKMLTPDWWERLPIVPFRELCYEELAEATRKYLTRQLDDVRRRVDATMRRRASWAIGAAEEHRWVGTVRHGPRSVAVLEAYVNEQAAQNQLVGGRQGGWIISDVHNLAMRPAIQRLLTPDGSGETLVTAGGRRRATSLLNSTTYTYTASICLEVEPVDLGAMPRLSFKRIGEGELRACT